MSNFPQMGKKLFISGGHPKEYAHIAWGDIDTQFYGYIRGYKEAADAIIQQALEKGDNATLDTYVFPACFLYRQYLELALKDIYLANSQDSRQDKIATIKSCGHRLVDIWKKVKPLILADFPNDDKSVLNAVEDYIKQFAKADAGSFAFRYPITKDLELVNNQEKFINLVNLAKRMSELEHFLSSVSMGMSAHRDFESEMLSYYAEDMSDYYY